MSTHLTLEARLRNEEGKGASRRLRRLESRVPAIIYGGKTAPKSISLALKDLVKAIENEAVFSQVITLDIEGSKEPALIKALQRHPAKGFPMHVDFQRIDTSALLTIRVPLHFINQEQCVGVKTNGGQITHYTTDVEISCLPANLPEFIEVDMANIDVGVTLHLSDLKLPEGVEIPVLALGHDHDQPIANVHKSTTDAE